MTTNLGSSTSTLGRIWRGRGLALALAALMAMPPVAGATAASHWVGSWAASPQPTWGADFAFPTNVPAALHEQTLRQVARVSLGGKRIRIVLSNEYGTQPLLIGAARVGLRAAAGSAVVPGSSRPIKFGGQTSATVPPGAPIVSDPIDLPVASLAHVSVSVYLPNETPTTTFHWDGRQTAFIAAGNQVAVDKLKADATVTARIFLSAIQVETTAPARAVVVIGDSITDGNGASIDSDSRWPDFLAKRLAPKSVAVLNAGISGARLLGDRMGTNALARFDRDALSQSNAKTVVVMLGINDISWPGTAFDPQGTRPSAETLVSGYRQLIARAHDHGLRIVGVTLTPFEGALPGTPLANYYQPDKNALREKVNAWIRTSHEFDAVLDFDALARDPMHTARLKPEVDSGDHLHPGDRGNKILADSIKLNALL